MTLPNKPVLHGFRQKIEQFPGLNKYLTPSLIECVDTEHWFENRVIRYILSGENWDWIADNWERDFSEAELDKIRNSTEIFSVLHGSDIDYGEKLFDAMTEVKLARWARLNGYREIEKLEAGPGRRTPEFLMKSDGQVALAEAKHFRARDYLPSFASERLTGLAMKTGALSAVDLKVNTTYKYEQERQVILTERDRWLRKVREEFTETWFLSFIQQPSLYLDKPTEFLDGLLELKMTKGHGVVIPGWGGTLSPQETAELCLTKLGCDLITKLTQIKEYMDSEQPGATHAIVFFSGIDDWEVEWGLLWEQMESQVDPAHWLWDSISSIQEKARQLVGIPFELIVGKGNPVKYGPFPWKPGE